jgi:hypothetical protein
LLFIKLAPEKQPMSIVTPAAGPRSFSTTAKVLRTYPKTSFGSGPVLWLRLRVPVSHLGGVQILGCPSHAEA